jgi:hypothetical protein
MSIIRFFSNIFNSYVLLVHRFMGEDKHVWTPKDFILLITILIFVLFSIVLLFYLFGLV